MHQNRDSGLQRARDVFEEAGLAAPPVPAQLQATFREYERWVFATREIAPMDMYMFGPYLVEAMCEPVDDYVAVSHAGHGANSYGLNYHLVYGPVAVFAQTGWGGAYMDPDEAVADVARQFAQCRDIIEAVDEVRDALPGPPARLMVAESTFRSRATCRWLDRPLDDERAAFDWLDEAGDTLGRAGLAEPDTEAARPSLLTLAIELLRAKS